MSIVERAKNLLLDPKATWPTIEAESASVQSIYVPYVAALAAISAVAGFIGMSIVGVGGFGVSFRVPLVSGLLNMVVGFVLALAMVFVMALITDALAPTFGGQKNQINALKLIGYGSTAGFLGGIFNVIPAASVLGLLAALYSVYLIYTGVPVLMKCPKDKALTYTAVLVLCGIVAGMILSWGSMMFGGGMGRAMGMGGLGSMKRQSFEAESNSAMVLNVATAKVRYGADGQQLRLSITDTGGLAAVKAAVEALDLPRIEALKPPAR